MWGEYYNSSHVEALAISLRRHTTRLINIICYTDVAFVSDYVDTVCLVVPNPELIAGCLRRLHMFDPQFGLNGTVISVDLDARIVGSLDRIERQALMTPFCISKGSNLTNPYNGSLFSFRIPEMKHVWERHSTSELSKAQTLWAGTDQAWFQQVAPGMPTYTDIDHGVHQWRSLRQQLVQPSNKSIVFFAGVAKPNWLTLNIPLQMPSTSK